MSGTIQNQISVADQINPVADLQAQQAGYPSAAAMQAAMLAGHASPAATAPAAQMAAPPQMPGILGQAQGAQGGMSPAMPATPVMPGQQMQQPKINTPMASTALGGAGASSMGNTISTLIGKLGK